MRCPKKIARNGGFCPQFLLSMLNVRGRFLLPMNYVVRPSFEKIGAETAEKECLEKIKNSTQNIMVARP